MYLCIIDITYIKLAILWSKCNVTGCICR